MVADAGIQKSLEEKIRNHSAYGSISPAKDYAYAIIKDAILNLWLEPGTGITEKGMAAVLNLSQTPVREAFVRLAQEKLLVVVPQRGTYVAKINPETVLNASYIRRTLERDAISRIQLPLSAGIERRLRSCLEQQAEWMDCPHTDETAIQVLRIDFQFHRLLFEAAGLAFVCDVIELFNMHNQRLHLLCYKVTPEWEIFLERHRAIFSALKDNNQEALTAAWEEHYSEIEDNLAKGSMHYPEYFVGNGNQR